MAGQSSQLRRRDGRIDGQSVKWQMMVMAYVDQIGSPVSRPPTKRNPYRSPLRAEQAAATRRLILDAATRLFVERGYAGTSIDAIADEAGVGRSTVFAAASGKSWLLKTAYDRAVAGDDEPIPVRERPYARHLFEMTDPGRIIDSYARFIAEAGQR